ncbi:actin-related protein RO7 [Aspergillus nomiae NRRL 13137]|uniref:Actin-related protein RO7 n=1 Tax=Aspergillus nomiae NRRL (strain ATCC 15546 / NRRL 13137 / CBS 260.88 / M93) TaxID=1509407 RepID=A0A0L1J1R3_ASPN3|nr:actin-related protein RO7 [Aspergillus nomiae NRRL 13137]KNG85694.1 actin-related protein RO7 [Aspergillus nomiae NRRL 13137]
MTSGSTAYNLDDRSTSVSMSLRHSQSGRPSTPQHHLRSNNSSFASTSSASSLRGEEDAIVFEFGSRWLRAGFEGDSTPTCVVGCGPEDSRRAGDYRGWLKASLNADTLRPQPVKAEEWTGAYELWKMDVRDVDLGLVEDKIERMFRETYNKYLLTDAGTARLVLVVPSIMPHPLLSSVLSTLFSRWRFPSITLLPSPTMAVAAAGLRSALVVDLGWAETTVTGIYEYREIATKGSTRAMKSLLQETGRFLTRLSSNSNGDADEISVNFEYCEEVASRFLWCKPQAGDHGSSATSQLTDPQEGDSGPTEEDIASLLHKTVSIPSPSNPSSNYMDIPFSKLSEPVEKVLFAKGVADCDLDDEEKPVALLVYNTLLQLPPDVRGICMSRIVFVGGGANIPGVRQRVLAEVSSLIDQHGWSPVRGKVIEQQRQMLQILRLNERQTSVNNANDSTPPSPKTSVGKGDQEKRATEEEEIDPVEEKLRRSRDKDTKPAVQGVLREVESLGPWAGASLVASLKIRSLVEIEREKFLQHGLTGASRDFDTHGHVPDRRSGLRSGGDRSSWTLAGWG